MNRSEDPRAGYLAIASTKFAADGYHGASLADLAGAAGVTKQALLHFFRTKERLYAEVLTELAERQCAEIDAAARPNPADHLIAYFARFRTSALSRPQDVRLVVRALLDSDERARTWPMKPYLDNLIALARRTPGGRNRSTAEILAWLSHIIGAIQYLAISSPAISGMYGKDAAAAVEEHCETILAEAVRTFVASKAG